MHLLGRDKLNLLRGLDEPTNKWLTSWISEVSHAHWKQPADLLDQYPHAQQIGQGIFLFPAGTCGYAVQLMVAFHQSVALVTSLVRN